MFKNLRIMNGNSKMGFGGAVEVSGPVDLTFINCEFGGSISEFVCVVERPMVPVQKGGRRVGVEVAGQQGV